MIVNLWVNILKPAFGKLNDWIKQGEPRKPVPLFSCPEEAAAYLGRHVKYTGDPLGGAADFYLHPERLQAAMESSKVHTVSVDCDDYATWFYMALLVMGARPRLYSLVDAGVVGSHVICVGTFQGRCYGLDTNGCRLLSDLQPETLCAEWSRIYQAQGYRYVEAQLTDYPF